MKLAKSLLLGSAAGLVTVGAAHAADLPTRKAAPVEYVRVCDAYGAGFFYIPGTDTCLRVGGLVLAQTRIQTDKFGAGVPSAGTGIAAPINATAFTTPFGLPANTFFGALPSSAGASFYRPGNGTTRDLTGFDAAARVELDARTQSPWGTVRTFVRLTGQFGSGANSTTGSIQSMLGSAGTFNNAIAATTAKELVYLDKAFIQFAGITAGRVQSFFDFYADAINYESLRGSNNNVWALAYTATFGGGFSATLAVEDPSSHRGPVGNVVGLNGLAPFNTGTSFGIGPGGFSNISGFAGTQAATRVPDIIGNVRLDQPWGAVQLAAALHPVRALLTSAQALAASGVTGAIIAPGTPGTLPASGTLSVFGPQPYGNSYAQTTSYGFAVQGGVQLNLDNVFGTSFFSAGDKMWLQATYSRGGVGYTDGANMAFVSGPNSTAAYGIGLSRSSNGFGYGGTPFDCVFTYSGRCELSTSFAITSAIKHYWTPTISSGLFGSYYQENYPSTAIVPVGIFAANGFAGTNVGVTNYKEIRVGTNLVWTPVKNFDLGTEFTYIRSITSRPYGMAPDFALNAAGLPSFQSGVNAFYGKIRAIRAF